MARNNQRSRKTNNPEGRNQFTNGFFDSARDRPVATAAAAAAAVGAGVFLWSRRNQISEQISNLSEQFSDWTGTQGGSSGDFEFADAGTTSTSSGSTTPSGRGRGKRGKSGGQSFTETTDSTGTGGSGETTGGTGF